MTITTRLVAELHTIPDVTGIAARTIVALPPSDLDPAEDEMRLRMGDIEVIREYDPELEQP